MDFEFAEEVTHKGAPLYTLRSHRPNAGESGGKSKGWTTPSLTDYPEGQRRKLTFAKLHPPGEDHDPDTVVMCEGAKSAYAVTDAGRQSASWNGGSGKNAVDKADFTRLQGKKLIFWPDADTPGLKALAMAVPKFAAVGLASFKVVDVGLLPGVDREDIPENGGKDAADVSAAERLKIIDAAADYDLTVEQEVRGEVATARETDAEHGPWARTPLGDAERLLTEHGDKLLVVFDPEEANTASLRLLEGRSGLWRDDRPRIEALLVKTARHWDHTGFNTEAARKVREWALKTASPAGQQKALDQVGAAYRSMEERGKMPAALTSCDVRDLDSKGEYMGTPAGVLDVTTGRVLSPEESRTKLVSLRIPDAYDPKATHPGVTKILDNFGPNDQEWFIQAMGCALRGYCQERIYLLHGEGDAGKSTVVDAVDEVLGEYGRKMGSTAFTPDRFGQADRPEPSKFEVAGGVRVAIIDEPKLGADGSMAWETVKDVSGSQTGRARLLRRNYVSLRYTATMLWAMNDLPSLPLEARGDRGAVYRRLRVLSLLTIPPGQRDSSLKHLFKTSRKARQALFAIFVKASMTQKAPPATLRMSQRRESC